MNKSRNAYICKRKNLNTRKDETPYPKVSLSIQSFELSKKVSNKSLTSPYASSPPLNFTTAEEIHRPHMHKSLKNDVKDNP